MNGIRHTVISLIPVLRVVSYFRTLPRLCCVGFFFQRQHWPRSLANWLRQRQKKKWKSRQHKVHRRATYRIIWWLYFTFTVESEVIIVESGAAQQGGRPLNFRVGGLILGSFRPNGENSKWMLSNVLFCWHTATKQTYSVHNDKEKRKSFPKAFQNPCVVFRLQCVIWQ